MQLNIENITPAMAAELLANFNDNNRPLSERVVSKFAQDMLAGRWKLNGETIIIAATGRLLDGQHRMAGVIKANKTVPMAVARQADETTFDTIDSGQVRRASDIFSMQGFTNPNLLQASGSAAYNYIAGGRDYKFTRKALTDFVVDHIDRLQPLANMVMSKPMRVRRGPLVSVLFLANTHGQYDAKIASFIDGISTGAGLVKGDPRLTLREWFDNNRKRVHGKEVSKEAAFGAIVRAWNAWANGRTINTLKVVSWTYRDDMPVEGFDRAMYPTIPEARTQRGNGPRAIAKNWSRGGDADVLPA